VIDDPAAKLEPMRRFTERILSGRWDDARQPSDRVIKSHRDLQRRRELDHQTLGDP
jgi:hypothetical protein